jgi:hypothetical protein
MAKILVTEVSSRLDTLIQQVAWLAEQTQDLLREQARAAERELALTMALADAKAQLKELGDAGRKQQSAAAETQAETLVETPQEQPQDDLPPAWWQQAGLEEITCPADDAVEVTAALGFKDNPYAQVLKSKARGTRALAVVKPDVAARLYAEGRFSVPPGVKYVCFCR